MNNFLSKRASSSQIEALAAFINDAHRGDFGKPTTINDREGKVISVSQMVLHQFFVSKLNPGKKPEINRVTTRPALEVQLGLKKTKLASDVTKDLMASFAEEEAQVDELQERLREGWRPLPESEEATHIAESFDMDPKLATILKSSAALITFTFNHTIMPGTVPTDRIIYNVSPYPEFAADGYTTVPSGSTWLHLTFQTSKEGIVLPTPSEFKVTQSQDSGDFKLRPLKGKEAGAIIEDLGTLKLSYK